MTQNPKQILHSTLPLAQLAVAACKAYGMNRVVISPGSRNAPLTLGFTSDPFFECYSIVDERCAGFFALGMSQQTAVPTVLVCTSGSALLNYFPAIAEAYYSNIPLVVLSADRPPERIDIGDGQTIQQDGVFHKHVSFSASCVEDCQPGSENYQNFEFGLKTALKLKRPVHLNLPFSEPLYEQTVHSSVSFKATPAHEEAKVPQLTDAEIKTWNSAGRIMILTGTMEPGSVDTAIINKLLKDPRVLMLTETTSNLHHPGIVSGIDQLIAALTEKEFKDLQPDLLITMGGMIVSKKIKAFLRDYSPKHHWHIDPLIAYDTFFVLSRHFKTQPRQLLSSLITLEGPASDYQKQWLLARDQRRAKHEPYLERIPYSDLKVYGEILGNLPSTCQLQVANSAAIRYTQLFELPEAVKVYCNRGTSGIDGSTSTAIGAAIASKEQVVFLSGDLSFFYDSNALWNNYTPANFKIVLVNNSGGGIFRILPGDKSNPDFARYFETVHELNAEKLCAMYNWKYQAASSMTELSEILASDFWDHDGPAVLEVFTPRTENDQLLLDYFESVK